MKRECPSCHSNQVKLTPTVSPDYMRLECFNQIPVTTPKQKKQKTVKCGYVGFVRKVRE